MGRAFREGVSQDSKVRMRVKKRSWRPLADLQGLSGRTRTIGDEMGPLVDDPAMDESKTKSGFLSELAKRH